VVLTIEEIKEIIPHRYPFLLVDRILELEPLKRGVGIKNVTANEPFFQGHFPNKPVMPGVLLLEAMAQVGGVSLLYPDENRGKLAYFASMEGVKFRKPVVPGDQVRMEAEVTRLRGSVGKVRAEAFVDGQLVAEAEFMFSLSEKQE
jgi:3-hydroxyacyl-[acyl-carrier-protein] dehydratase